MNKQELIDDIEKNKNEFYKLCTDMKSTGISRGIGTGIYMGLLISQKKIEHLDEQPKVTVPKFVADWFEKNKDDFDFAIYAAVAHSIKESDYYRYPEGFIEWIELADNKPIETIIRMKDGYEVEKEPIYEVVFLEDDNGRHLLMELSEKSYEVVHESENDGYRTQWFTESEIKSIDERYWAFAVPVEEVK